LFRESKCCLSDASLGILQGHANHADDSAFRPAKWFDVRLQVASPNLNVERRALSTQGATVRCKYRGIRP